MKTNSVNSGLSVTNSGQLNSSELSVIFVNENENENGEKRKYNEFVNEN